MPVKKNALPGKTGSETLIYDPVSAFRMVRNEAAPENKKIPGSGKWQEKTFAEGQMFFLNIREVSPNRINVFRVRR